MPSPFPRPQPAPKLFPRGTSLADIPTGFRGCSWAAWVNQIFCEDQIFCEENRRGPLPDLPLATSRDNYGMKGVKSFRNRTLAL